MTRPRLYSGSPVRRALQIALDIAAVVVIVLAIVLSRAVHAAVAALGDPGRSLERTGRNLSSSLTDAGDRVGGIPLVGRGVRTPFDSASDAAGTLTSAGRSLEQAATTAAFWLALAVAVIPIVLVLYVWLPRRIGFIRRATATARLLDAGADLDLFALRAMATQPAGRLRRVHPRPAEAWRRGDPEVIRALAALELRDVGLTPPGGR